MNFVAPVLSVSFYLAAAPILILAVSSSLALLCGVSKRLGSVSILRFINLAGIGLALAATIFNLAQQNLDSFLQGSFLADGLGYYAQLMILSIALITSILNASTFISERYHRGEIVSIWHMVLLGMLTMVSTNELISLFIGLEITSIGLYALIGYIKPSRMSKEGAVKYLILGSFASGFMLFGFALLFAGTGSMQISTVVSRFASAGEAQPWIELGLLLSLVGFGFKLALAPFHMWAPDAYESAPTGLTAFMATAVKVMVMVVMVRFLAHGMQHLSSVAVSFFMFTAVASVLIGNVLALVQSSFKRMLAYSSVAHAGYMAIAICALTGGSKTLSISAVLFYLISYSFISLAVFAVLMWLESEHQDNIQIEDLSGLASTHPWSAFAISAAMFAFAGIPPTGGFMGKLFLFNAALLEGYYGLVIVGIVAAVIGVYYYLRVIVKIYMQPRKPYVQFSPKFSAAIVVVVATSLVMTLLLGTFLPNRAMYLIKQAPAALIDPTH